MFISCILPFLCPCLLMGLLQFFFLTSVTHTCLLKHGLVLVSKLAYLLCLDLSILASWIAKTCPDLSQNSVWCRLFLTAFASHTALYDMRLPSLPLPLPVVFFLLCAVCRLYFLLLEFSPLRKKRIHSPLYFLSYNTEWSVSIFIKHF